jgi:predicted nucleotidyltransferase component of viral defense system
MPIRWHDEAPDELREAIRFTAEETGFVPRMIEKDYFCSVILEALGEAGTALVFKGGTCLAKVHAGFFRLSEDLDFSIPTPIGATRSDRRRAVGPVKALVDAIPASVSALELRTRLTGQNVSTQYHATLAYRSLLAPRTETIEIEIGLREPTLTEPQQADVHTMLLHWVRGDPFVRPFATRCLSYQEAMAEKLRAALARREPAIRDFFDIDHAVHVAGFDVGDVELVRILRGKLAVPGTGRVDVSEEQLVRLRQQVDSLLRPVLREREFGQFDLDRAFGIVRGVAERLG